MSDMARKFRRKVSALMEKYGIEEPALEDELFDLMTFARAYQPDKQASGPDKSKHPAVRAVHEITGTMPAPILFDEIIDLVGAQPDTADMRRAYADWLRGGRNAQSIIWLKWMNQNRRKPQAPASKADPFAAMRAAGLGD